MVILSGFKQLQVVTCLNINATPVAQQIAGAEPVLQAGALTWMETSELMHHTTPTPYCITKEKMLLEKIEFLKSKVSFHSWIITDGNKWTNKQTKNHSDKIHSCRYHASQWIHLRRCVFCLFAFALWTFAVCGRVCFWTRVNVGHQQPRWVWNQSHSAPCRQKKQH